MFWGTISFALIACRSLYQLFVWHLGKFSGCEIYNSAYCCTKKISFSLLSLAMFSPGGRHLRTYITSSCKFCNFRRQCCLPLPLFSRSLIIFTVLLSSTKMASGLSSRLLSAWFHVNAALNKVGIGTKTSLFVFLYYGNTVWGWVV